MTTSGHATVVERAGISMILDGFRSRAHLLRTAGVAVVVAGLVAGCAAGGKVSPSTQGRSASSLFDGPLTLREQADIRAMQARIKAKLASGYVFKSVGTASSGTVHSDGSFAGRLGPGDHIRISIVPKSEAGDHVVIGDSKNRSTMFETQGCGDDCAVDGNQE